MTICFAAARSADHSSLVNVFAVRLPLSAANDNASGIAGNAILKAALRHFAEHGLSAAEAAREKAQKAFFAGNRAEYRRWLEICAALDRRLAKVATARGWSTSD